MRRNTLLVEGDIFYQMNFVNIIVCDLLQAVAAVAPFDRDRVASVIVRDVSRTNPSFKLYLLFKSFQILKVF